MIESMLPGQSFGMCDTAGCDLRAHWRVDKHRYVCVLCIARVWQQLQVEAYIDYPGKTVQDQLQLFTGGNPCQH